MQLPTSAPLMPNAETVEAMEAVRQSELTKVSKQDKLLERLQSQADSQ